MNKNNTRQYILGGDDVQQTSTFVGETSNPIPE
jgi:hypothetical protein